MNKALQFLEELIRNNNRDWFNLNKLRYKTIQEEVTLFAEELILGISKFDPAIAGLTAKECSYRIYRDTRFSNDKRPYKTHIGIHVCKGGKCSGNAGYYFHIEPKNNGWLGGSMITSGLYRPEPSVLKSVREDILCNGEKFVKTIKAAKGFVWDDSGDDKLSRPPKGFPSESPYIEYIKQKNYFVSQMIDNKLLFDQNKLLKFCINEFKKTKPFVEHLNRAVDFARNECE